MITLGIKRAIERRIEAEVNLTMAVMDEGTSDEDIAKHKEDAKQAEKSCDSLVRFATSILDTVGLLYQYTEYVESEEGLESFEPDEYYLAQLFERIAPWVDDDREAA